MSRKTHSRAAAFASSSKSRYTDADSERVDIVLYRKNAGEKIRLSASQHRYKARRHILFLPTRRVKPLSKRLPQCVLRSGTKYLKAQIRHVGPKLAELHPGERLFVIDSNDAIGTIQKDRAVCAATNSQA